MSLKAFHIFFIVISTLLSIGFGLWALMRYQQTQMAGFVLTAIGSIIFGVGLVGYGVWFLRKLKNVSFL